MNGTQVKVGLGVLGALLVALGVVLYLRLMPGHEQHAAHTRSKPQTSSQAGVAQSPAKEKKPRELPTVAGDTKPPLSKNSKPWNAATSEKGFGKTVQVDSTPYQNYKTFRYGGAEDDSSSKSSSADPSQSASSRAYDSKRYSGSMPRLIPTAASKSEDAGATSPDIYAQQRYAQQQEGGYRPSASTAQTAPGDDRFSQWSQRTAQQAPMPSTGRSYDQPVNPYRQNLAQSDVRLSQANAAQQSEVSSSRSAQLQNASAQPSAQSMSQMSIPARTASVTPEVQRRENTGSYYVEPGDSFWKISQKIYGDGAFYKALQEHNRRHFPNSHELNVGDEVLTPKVADLRDKYNSLCPKERTVQPGTPAATAGLVPVSSGQTYVVEEGDTLWDIAKYELGDASRWAEILQLNRQVLVDIDYLRPGTQLKLPASGDQPMSYPRENLAREPQSSLR